VPAREDKNERPWLAWEVLVAVNCAAESPTRCPFYLKRRGRTATPSASAAQYSITGNCNINSASLQVGVKFHCRIPDFEFQSALHSSLSPHVDRSFIIFQDLLAVKPRSSSSPFPSPAGSF
jgi:hypothetical protein